MEQQFLPVSPKEVRSRGWQQPDFILVTGDAYVDHHSFGAAVIGRSLERAGYKVAVMAQPYWRDSRDFQVWPEPRLGFLVTAGNMDSMVSHYSVNKKRRKKDAYSPGGNPGHRPDRAVIVYTRLIREAFGDANVIVGGLEASLRRFAHYDYWSDRVHPSVLEECGADLLVFGMGERIIRQIAEQLNLGFSARQITWIPGTCFLTDAVSVPENASWIPGLSQIREDPEAFNTAFRIQYEEQDFCRGGTLCQKQQKGILIQNPPAPPLSREELDEVFSLPYTRAIHPSYEGQGGIPALEEVQNSVTSCRGCFGSCSFCAITFHQGRVVVSRSPGSILEEIRGLAQQEGFDGVISDIGGPTANFRNAACSKQMSEGSCRHRQCLYPEPCPNLEVDHSEYLKILRQARRVPGVRHVFVRSGIRYDYVLADRDKSFLKELCSHHVSGRLKVAPEHISPAVLELMQKPPVEVYEQFRQLYAKTNQKLGREQYLVPYLISSHPGSTLQHAIELALYLKRTGTRPEQVQDFYPVPGTLATAMYYTGRHPVTGETVYVARSQEEKQMQRALLQYDQPHNRALVRKALRKAGRDDLIGTGKGALVPPERPTSRRKR